MNNTISKEQAASVKYAAKATAWAGLAIVSIGYAIKNSFSCGGVCGVTLLSNALEKEFSEQNEDTLEEEN